MCREHSGGRRGVCGGLDVRLPRTRVLLLGLVLSVAAWLPPPACADLEMDLLGGMVLIEADGEDESLAGGRSELEASMHSSLLQDFQEVTDGLQATDVMETGATRWETATPSAFPDTSAVVGRIFQIKVPNRMEDVYLGDIIKRYEPLTVRTFLLQQGLYHLLPHIYNNVLLAQELLAGRAAVENWY